MCLDFYGRAASGFHYICSINQFGLFYMLSVHSVGKSFNVAVDQAQVVVFSTFVTKLRLLFSVVTNLYLLNAMHA